MSKSSHFSGQPLYGKVIKLLDKSKVLDFSRKYGGERYVKRFDCWTHLIVMLYAVIQRFDSLREITTSLLAETHKLGHIGIHFKIGRSTLADANKRRSEAIFEAIYRDLYATYRTPLSSDSRSRKTPKWMQRLQIIDSTTITLFSNLIFKGGRPPPEDRQEEGRNQSAYCHTCQRRSTIGYQVHLCGYKRFIHAQTIGSLQGGYHGYGSCLYRLWKVSAAYRTWRYLCH